MELISWMDIVLYDSHGNEITDEAERVQFLRDWRDGIQTDCLLQVDVRPDSVDWTDFPEVAYKAA